MRIKVGDLKKIIRETLGRSELSWANQLASGIYDVDDLSGYLAHFYELRMSESGNNLYSLLMKEFEGIVEANEEGVPWSLAKTQIFRTLLRLTKVKVGEKEIDSLNRDDLIELGEIFKGVFDGLNLKRPKLPGKPYYTHPRGPTEYRSEWD